MAVPKTIQQALKSQEHGRERTSGAPLPPSRLDMFTHQGCHLPGLSWATVSARSTGAVSLVLYAIDRGLWDQNIMQSVVIDSVTYLLNLNLPNIDSVAMENYDFFLTPEYPT